MNAPATEAPDRRRRFRVTPLGVIATGVVLVLLFAQFVVGADMLSRATMSSLTPLIAIMAIVAIGQAFVIGTGGIDLSVPATMTLMGAILLKASDGKDGGLIGALVLCLVACIAIGLVNGVLVEVLGLNALVVTLAVGQLIAGVTRLYTGPILNVSNVPPQLADVAGASLNGLSYLLFVAVAVSILGAIVLHRIVYGRRLVASSAGKDAAFLVGVRARRYRVLAYVIASLTYGFAAVLLAGEIGTPDLSLGEPYLLSSVVAVVLGGAVLTGGRVSPVATFLGAVFLVVLDYVLRVEGLSAGARLMVQGGVLAVGLTLAFLVQNFKSIKASVRRARLAGPNDPAVVSDPGQ